MEEEILNSINIRAIISQYQFQPDKKRREIDNRRKNANNKNIKPNNTNANKQQFGIQIQKKIINPTIETASNNTQSISMYTKAQQDTKIKANYPIENIQLSSQIKQLNTNKIQYIEYRKSIYLMIEGCEEREDKVWKETTSKYSENQQGNLISKKKKTQNIKASIKYQCQKTKEQFNKAKKKKKIKIKIH
ncbi:hypothetical protein ABPG72_021203 [Tetrahymena utriculariae]